MEHLPHPSKPIRDKARVPYLGGPNSIFRGCEYDASQTTEAWEKYPERIGWEPRDSQEWYECFEKQPTEMARLLQTWFFFGLLEVALGVTLHPGDFIEQMDGNEVVSTKSLANEIGIRGRLASALLREHGSESGHIQWVIDIFRIISDFSHHCRGFTCANNQGGSHTVDPNKIINLLLFIREADLSDLNPLPQLVFLSICILNDTVLDAFTPTIMALLGSGEVNFDFTAISLYTFIPYNILYLQMRGDGWCPFQLAMLAEKFNATVTYFLSYIKRPGFDKVHPTIRISSTQRTIEGSSVSSRGPLCSSFKCMVHQLEQSGYRTRHASDCSQCEDVVADPDDIRSILETGSFPLILSIDPDDPEPSIELVAYEPGYSYIAISHVWSDGLGNLDRSALPMCQLRRLSHMVRNVLGDDSTILLFWLDTICCPPEAGHAQDLAISKMRQTYESASIVLVLDSWLWNQSFKEIYDSETILKILVSGWNGRLWTLQEGALAKRLFFQFADGAYDLDHGILMLDQMTDQHPHWLLRRPIQGRLVDFRGFRHSQINIEAQLAPLIRALAFRLTSVASDEALCLTALLNLDVSEIQKSSESSRMQTFWSLWQAVPLGLLFSWFGPRLDVEGFRWAPSTFLRNEVSKETNSIITMGFIKQLADRTPDGLRFSSRGLVLKANPLSADHRIGTHPWYIQNAQSHWYVVQCSDTINSNWIDVPNRDPAWGSGIVGTSARVLDPMIGVDLPRRFREPGSAVPYQQLIIIFPPTKYDSSKMAILTSLRAYGSRTGFYVKYVCFANFERITPRNMAAHRTNLDFFSSHFHRDGVGLTNNKTVLAIAAQPEFEWTFERPATWHVD